jgi:hypothetical protein
MAQLRPDGDVIRLILAADEVEVLASVASGLATRVSDAAFDGSSDAVIDRLAPTVSRGDADLDAELRAMLRADLLSSRTERLEAFATELRAAGRGAGEDVELRFDHDAAMRVVQALNDVRLALATTIGFDDTLRDELEPDDPRLEAVGLMDALAWLQGGLIAFIDGDA